MTHEATCRMLTLCSLASSLSLCMAQASLSKLSFESKISDKFPVQWASWRQSSRVTSRRLRARYQMLAETWQELALSGRRGLRLTSHIWKVWILAFDLVFLVTTSFPLKSHIYLFLSLLHAFPHETVFLVSFQLPRKVSCAMLSFISVPANFSRALP